MFIGWLKFSDVSSVVALAEAQEMLVDGYHIKLMMMHAPHLSYGAYDQDKLIGAALAVSYEKTTMIKYLVLDQEYQGQGIGKRLMQTLLTALEGDGKEIYLHAPEALEGFFEGFGFKSLMRIGRFINVGKVPPFHFSNAHAKELDAGEFDSVAKKLDRETFGEDRQDFLFDEMQRSSSLKFALTRSFQHSSVINSRHVYLGPWQVAEGFETEAEKMMKGVLYFRGLKKVIADVPMENTKAVELFKKYEFQNKQAFVHMRLTQEQMPRFQSIYAFSL